MEQDSQRCEELRRIDSGIRDQRAELVGAEDRERSKLSRLGAEHAELFSELVQLQAAQVATNVGSGAPGLPGKVVGAIDVATGITISNLKSKIQDIKIQISISEEKISRHQSNHNRLNRIQAENAERMRGLHCVTF